MPDNPDAVISPFKLWQVLADSGIIPPRTTRLIIDIAISEPVRIYTESYGTERLLRLDWINALKEAAPIIEYHTSDASGETGN